MTIKEFYTYVALLSNMEGDPFTRPGQNAFNLLHQRHPEIADKIRGTDLDPFHVDSRVKKMLIHLLEDEVV